MSDQPPSSQPSLLDELTPEVQFGVGRAWPWLLGVLILAAAIVVSFTVWRQPTRPDLAKELENIVAQGDQAEGQATFAAYRAQWGELASFVTEGRKAAEAGQREWAEHQRDLASLLDTDEGRRIAADAALVDQYQAIVEISGPAANINAQRIAEASALFDAIQQALSVEVTVKPPSAATTEAATSFQRETSAELDQIRRWRNQLATLRQAANRLSSGDISLRDVLAQRRSADSERTNAEIAVRWKNRQKELSDQRIAAELAERERKQRAIDEQAVRALREEADQAEAARAERARQADAAAKHRQRLAQFRQELPAIQPYLTPFITPGKMQLGKYGWEASAEAAPLSWAALQKILGARGDHRAPSFLANTFGELDTKNDRPFGSFPRRYQPDNDQAAMERLIDFLHDNGDLLVEEGLLRP